MQGIETYDPLQINEFKIKNKPSWVKLGPKLTVASWNIGGKMYVDVAGDTDYVYGWKVPE